MRYRLSAALRHIAVLTGSAALFAPIYGCGSSDEESSSTTGPSSTSSSSSGSGGGSTTGGPQAKKAAVRVVHASPDAPAVDVYAKGVKEPLIEGLAYGDTSEYLEVEAGEYDLELRASPSTNADPVAYSTGTIDLGEGKKYTAVAAGLLGSNQDSNRFRVLPLEEAFGAAGSGSAILRVVHASPDAPSVGIDLHNDDPSSPELTGLDRFTDSGAAGFPLTAGKALQLGIAAGGETVTAFTTPELPEGAQLFVIATGLLGKLAHDADGFSLLAVGPDGTIGFVKQNPIVYALHASPDAPAVDAFVGTTELVDDLSFGDLSAPVQVPPGDYDLEVYAHADGSSKPSGDPAVTAATGSLAAGERYLTIATGFLSSSDSADKFRFVSLAEGFEQADSPLLRAVHGSPDAPAVDVGILNAEKVVSPVLVSNVAFTNASDAAGLSTSVGTIPIGISPAGANSTVVASFHVATSPGMRAFAIAAGALDPAHGQSFRLLVVDTATTPWASGTIAPQPQ